MISQKFGIAFSTAHSAAQLIIDVLYRTISEFIHFPTTIEEMNSVAQAFGTYGFPNVIAALDGTHITVRPPSDNKTDYCSRKMQFAINLTATCDSNLRITSVFSGYTARVHDARVFKASPLFQKLNTIPLNFHILGDAAYALQKAVMTPFKDHGGRGLTVAEHIYNQRHSQTRMAIERCFGLLKGRWLKLNYLDCEPENWNKVVLACCVLHNICQTSVNDQPPAPELPLFQVALPCNAIQKRAMIVNYLLNSQTA